MKKIIFISVISSIILISCSLFDPNPKYAEILPYPYESIRLGMTLEEFRDQYKEREFIDRGEDYYGYTKKSYSIDDTFTNSEYFRKVRFSFDLDTRQLFSIFFDFKLNGNTNNELTEKVLKILSEKDFEKDPRWKNRFINESSDRFENYLIAVSPRHRMSRNRFYEAELEIAIKEQKLKY